MDDNLRLATVVTEMNEDFSEITHQKGFTRAFGGAPPVAGTCSRGTANPARSPARDSGYPATESYTPETDSPAYLELRDITTRTEALPEYAEDGIMEWIKQKYSRSKGYEIGPINPSLMPSLFAEQQSRAW